MPSHSYVWDARCQRRAPGHRSTESLPRLLGTPWTSMSLAPQNVAICKCHLVCSLCKAGMQSINLTASSERVSCAVGNSCCTGQLVAIVWSLTGNSAAAVNGGFLRLTRRARSELALAGSRGSPAWELTSHAASCSAGWNYLH